MLLRQQPRPTGVDEEVGIPVRQESHRGGRIRIGQGSAGQVDQLTAPLVAIAHQLEVRAGRLHVRDADTGPGRDIAPGRWPEGAQVGSDEVGLTLGDRAVARAQPLIRECQPVGPSTFPRA